MKEGLIVEGLTKVYTAGRTRAQALDAVDLHVPPGQMHAIIGPSGSGKSTLLKAIGCLQGFDSGIIRVHGIDVPDALTTKGAHFRSTQCGFVVQDFALIEHLSAVENVEQPLRFVPNKRMRRRERRRKASELLESFGITTDSRQPVRSMSGGERQRIAISRALINKPPLLLADEPTGALDTEHSREVMRILREAADQGRMVVVVTHDPEVARACDSVWELRDGQLTGGGERTDTSLESESV